MPRVAMPPVQQELLGIGTPPRGAGDHGRPFFFLSSLDWKRNHDRWASGLARKVLEGAARSLGRLDQCRFVGLSVAFQRWWSDLDFTCCCSLSPTETRFRASMTRSHHARKKTGQAGLFCRIGAALSAQISSMFFTEAGSSAKNRLGRWLRWK